MFTLLAILTVYAVVAWLLCALLGLRRSAGMFFAVTGVAAALWIVILGMAWGLYALV